MQEIIITTIRENDVPALAKILVERVRIIGEKSSGDIPPCVIKWIADKSCGDSQFMPVIENYIRRAAGMKTVGAADIQHQDDVHLASEHEFWEALATQIVQVVESKRREAALAFKKSASLEEMEEKSNNENYPVDVHHLVTQIIKIFRLTNTLREFEKSFELPEWFAKLLRIIKSHKGNHNSKEQTEAFLKTCILKELQKLLSKELSLNDSVIQKVFTVISDIIKYVYTPTEDTQYFMDILLNDNTRDKLEPYFLKVMDVITLTEEQKSALEIRASEFLSMWDRIGKIQVEEDFTVPESSQLEEKSMSENMVSGEEVRKYLQRKEILIKLFLDFDALPENFWSTVDQIVIPIEEADSLLLCTSMKIKMAAALWREKIENYQTLISSLMRQYVQPTILESGKLEMKVMGGKNGVTAYLALFSQIEEMLSNIEKIPPHLREEKIVSTTVSMALASITAFLKGMLFSTPDIPDVLRYAREAKQSRRYAARLMERVLNLQPKQIQLAVPEIWPKLIRGILKLQEPKERESHKYSQVKLANTRQAQKLKQLQEKINLNQNKGDFFSSDQDALPSLEKIGIVFDLASQLDAQMGWGLPEDMSQLQAALPKLLRLRKIYSEHASQHPNNMQVQEGFHSLLSTFLVLVGFCLNAGKKSIFMEEAVEGDKECDLPKLHAFLSKEYDASSKFILEKIERADKMFDQLVQKYPQLSQNELNQKMTADDRAFRAFITSQWASKQLKVAEILTTYATNFAANAKEKVPQKEPLQLLAYQGVLVSDKECWEKIRDHIKSRRYIEAKEECEEMLKSVKDLKTELLVHLTYMEIYITELRHELRKRITEAKQQFMPGKDLAHESLSRSQMMELAREKIVHHQMQAKIISEKLRQQWAVTGKVPKDQEEIIFSTDIVLENGQDVLELLEIRERAISARAFALKISGLQAKAAKGDAWYQNKPAEELSPESQERAALKKEIAAIRKLKASLKNPKKALSPLLVQQTPPLQKTKANAKPLTRHAGHPASLYPAPIAPESRLSLNVRKFILISVSKLNASISLKGGAVRGMVRKEPIKDWDCLTEPNRASIDAKLSSIYPLHQNKHCSFLTTCKLDTGEDIDLVSASDLPPGWLADFTINELQYKCSPQKGFHWFDHTCGRIIKDPTEFSFISDINHKILRVRDLKKIRNNPGLILKALEMIWRDQYTLDLDLEKWIQRNGAQLLRDAIREGIQEPQGPVEAQYAEHRSVILHNVRHTLKPLMDGMLPAWHACYAEGFLKGLNMEEVMGEMMAQAAREEFAGSMKQTA